ncbi:MAG: rod-binding protein [Thermodesulfobacteriota bacterium]
MEISPEQMLALTKAGQQTKMSPQEKEQLRKACNDFEALLTKQMLSTMRESTFETEGLFEKSYGEKLFQSMADQEMAERMATGGGIGFGDMLFQQLTKNS